MISEQQKPVDSGFGAKTEPSEVLDGIDLNGKVALVTGGYSGIGLETARGLKDAGARVIVPARRTDVAKSELSGVVDEEDILEMDLADPASVNRFVSDFQNSETSLDILINNASSNGMSSNAYKRRMGFAICSQSYRSLYSYKGVTTYNG